VDQDEQIGANKTSRTGSKAGGVIVVRFYMLGPFEARSAAGAVVRIGGARQRKLLALLALRAGQSVSLTHLIDELWEEAPQSARQQVHNAIRALRKDLGDDDLIVTTDIGYRLAVAASATDTQRFQELLDEAGKARDELREAEAIRLLGEACGLWRGAFVAGLHSSSLDSAAARMNELHLSALETSSELRLTAGETAGLIHELRELVERNPLREALAATLVRAMHAEGQQAEALAMFDRTRRALADELGVDPGPQLRAAYELVLHGGAESAPPAQPPPPRAPSQTANTLPHDIGEFSGRTEEIERLLDITKQRSATAVVISAIDGMGGVGKSTLAVHLGHRLAEEFPDGQYFIDLRGFSHSNEPLPPSQALDHLLLDAGLPPELIPSDLDRKQARWRAHTAGKQLLVILDNAATEDQVQPLLPGTAGVLAIVTSRRKLVALSGSVPLSIDVLPHDDAVGLFLRVAGEAHRQHQAEVDEVVELCGRLPLAIQIAAARLRDRHSWSVLDLAERLRDHARRKWLLNAGHRGVMPALELSYQSLDYEQQRVFRLLSINPGPDFDAHLVAALCATGVDAAEAVLEHLYEHNLLKQQASGRFHFHDLVFDCARELSVQLDAACDQHQARVRLFDYLLDSTLAWCGKLGLGVFPEEEREQPVQHVIKRAESVDDPVTLIGIEYANIVAATRFAAQHGWHGFAWQLPCALQPFLKLRNYSGSARELLEAGLRAATGLDAKRGEAACHQVLAAIHRERGSSTTARQHLSDAIAISTALGDHDRVVMQLVDLGTALLSEDKVTEGHAVLREAEGLLPLISKAWLGVVVNNNLGSINRDRGAFAEATTHLERALALEQANDRSPRSLAFVLWNLGMLHHTRGDLAAATRTFEEVMAVSLPAQFVHGEAFACIGLSLTCRSSGEFAAAVDHGRRALRLTRELGLRWAQSEAQLSVGEITYSRGDLDHAESIHRQALQDAEEQGRPRYTSRALEGLAHVAWRRGDHDTAAKLWRDAIEALPDGLASADNPRRHLQSLHEPATECARCRTSPPLRSVHRGLSDQPRDG
jgi:DNA-binding SARP family transcriptional activator/tetratricopeptide (TPR) repeat protein